MTDYSEHDIEFYYALDGGQPIKIAGGSAEDFQRIWDEAEALDAAVGHDPLDIIGPGTRHFYRCLSQTAGIDPGIPEAVLDHYESLATGSRKNFRDKLVEGDV